MNVADTFKKPFMNLKDKHMVECAICLLDYKDSDVILELKCDRRHYFHEQCINQWMERNPKCPLCKRPIQK